MLPYDKNHLTFRFNGVNMIRPEKVRYQFKLERENRQEEWSPITLKNEITFSNIDPGKYVFKVRAQNDHGYWNEKATTFSFRITPPFWETCWFIVASSISGILVVLLFIKLRLRKLRKEKVKLEGLVRERTKDLEIEKQKSEELLLNILPEETAEELKAKGFARTRDYEFCSVLFTDFKGFTQLSEEL